MRPETEDISNMDEQVRNLTVRYRLSLILMVFLGLFAAWSSPAQARTLKVGVWNEPPYVIVNSSGTIAGMSLQVWKVMAKEAGIDYEMVVYDNIDDIFGAFGTGAIDASVGPHAATASRAGKVLFTQPYFTTSIGIMARITPSGPLERLRPFLTKAFITGIISLILILLIVGQLLWTFERRHNPDEFPTSWVKGVGSGMWVALSVLTSVGFGDVVPRTRGGRIICSIWMIISMGAATTLTAGVASVLTTSFTAQYMPARNINTVSELHGKSIAVITGTYADKVILKNGGTIIYRDSVPGAVQGLLDKDYDALAFDRMALVYYLESKPNRALRVTEVSMAKGFLAFAFSPREQKIFDKFNVQLLAMQEAGTLDDIINSWVSSIREGAGIKEPEKK
jgi:polar amino acid transport system substrate-binding protein